MTKTTILTGAASGLGRAMTLGLLEAGIDVAAVDKDETLLRKFAGVAVERRLRGALQTITADLSHEESFAIVVDAALARFGNIDALVNNAGIGQSSVRADQRRNPIRFWEITPEQWHRFVAVNATAPLLMARAVAPHMIKGGSGRIVTVTTSLGTMIRGGYILYGASKSAAEAATAIMAADLAGTGVTANVLVPGGMTDTRIIPESEVPQRHKLLRPEIMVPPLLWLLSDAAAHVTARRFLAVHWDPSLPAEQAVERSGAAIAWTSIATMPIEPV
jgi:NAD(P)-dependent dehydrogenase (short-subunit alcohol dehydrogenase family)